ncbi:MAG: serine/threonine protein kinase, partial [Gemmataceae bacterium]|nr:serine/threonine protein kinase [Gemmataceae bacterium]
MTGMIGARVGNWYVEAEAGRGPGGAVYRAKSYADGRPAAVKLLDDPHLAPKLAAELLALRRLDHPNIAAYLDSGTHAGRPYLAAEWVDGTDAAKLLAGGRRPWPEVLSVAVQVARALKHGHNRNVLHRDLKPAHLMLTADGTVKLLAFGLARVVPPHLAPTPVLGSAAYLPPETAGGKPPTRRADFYSLGGLLYTLATGRPPFAAATLVELTHKQCYALPERPGMVVPGLPVELDEFICGLLAKDPARRPATAPYVLEDRERIRGKR